MALNNSFSHITHMKTYESSNERYTKEYCVYPLTRYIPKDKVIWCPCDLESSAYVKVFKREGYSVEHSHIAEGKDFYTYEPTHYDIIVTNPPFSNKANFMKRVISLKKPFAIFLPLTWLNDCAPFKLFKDMELQLMIFNKRATFENPTLYFKATNPPFACGYFAWRVFNKQIVFECLEEKGLFG